MSEYNKIVTHFDLDGIASAALCALIFDIDNIEFAGPANLNQAQIDKNTIVTDLPYPYPKEPGLWFDHHMANIEELATFGIDAKNLAGKIAGKPSCLNVVYNYFADEFEIDDWKEFVAEVDTIDGFLYKTFDEWREITPGKKLDYAIKQDHRDYAFMRKLTLLLRDEDYLEVIKRVKVAERATQFIAGVDAQLSLIERIAKPIEGAEEIIFLDITNLKKPPKIEKNLAYKFFPNAETTLMVKSQYQNGNRTNNLSFSMSLGFVDSEVSEKVDVGAIMRELEIGSGHPGAAAGRFDCKNKQEREEKKEKTLNAIIDLWKKQRNR